MGDTAVLISSCDRYQDLWRPFFILFFKYWPDCPYPLYLVSNRLDYSDPRVRVIRVGDDRDWSTNILSALARVSQPYILLLLEDYLLQQAVDTDRIAVLADYMKRRKAGCMRLYPCPGPDVICEDNPEVGEIIKGAAYRMSLQAAIWDKKVLMEIVQEGESPWYLEINGSTRTDALDAPFLSVTRETERPLPYFCTAVYRGRWLRDAVELCRKHGIEVDLRARKREPWHRYFRRIVLPGVQARISQFPRQVFEGRERVFASKKESDSRG